MSRFSISDDTSKNPANRKIRISSLMELRAFAFHSWFFFVFSKIIPIKNVTVLRRLFGGCRRKHCHSMYMDTGGGKNVAKIRE